jgi:hypothetical protein
MIVNKKNLRDGYYELDFWNSVSLTCVLYKFFIFISDSLWIEHLFFILVRNVLAPKFILVGFLLDFLNITKKICLFTEDEGGGS